MKTREEFRAALDRLRASYYVTRLSAQGKIAVAEVDQKFSDDLGVLQRSCESTLGHTPGEVFNRDPELGPLYGCYTCSAKYELDPRCVAAGNLHKTIVRDHAAFLKKHDLSITVTLNP